MNSRVVADAFADLSESDWQTPTLLEPFEPGRPPWTVFELAGHLSISIGLTSMLIADQQDGQPGRDHVSFFIFPRSEVAPVVYDYAYTMVDGKKPGGRSCIATPEGVAFTASLLDELLARRTVAGRPTDLADDLDWVRTASGRAPHPDPRLPLLG